MAIRRYQFDKLIRSNLPARMADEGVAIDSTKLEPAEYILKLKEKLQEEALEVAETSSIEKLTEELADVQEVLQALIEAAGIDLRQVEQARLKKRQINGHFAPENYVNFIEVAEDNKPVIEYLDNKDRHYKFENN